MPRVLDGREDDLDRRPELAGVIEPINFRAILSAELLQFVDRDLRDDSSGERIAAAAPLQLYIEQADRYSAKDTGFEAKTARERSTLALVALATRLDSDDDPSALETYATVLANVGPISVSELARANRKSALRFAREAGDYAASRLGPPDAEAQLRCESYEVQKGLLDDLHLIVIRSRMPLRDMKA